MNDAPGTFLNILYQVFCIHFSAKYLMQIRDLDFPRLKVFTYRLKEAGMLTKISRKIILLYI